MRIFYHKVNNETIENYQDAYLKVLEIGSCVNQMRNDIVSFCVGYIDNKSAHNNENDNILKCAKFLSFIAEDKRNIDDTIDSAALYLIEQYRKTGSRMKIRTVENPTSRAGLDIERLSEEQLQTAMNEYNEHLLIKINNINFQLDELMMNWKGENVEMFKKEVLKNLDKYATQYSLFNKSVNVEEKLEK